MNSENPCLGNKVFGDYIIVFFSSAAGEAVVAGGATLVPMTGPLPLGESPGLGSGLCESAKEESVKAVPNIKILRMWFAMKAP